MPSRKALVRQLFAAMSAEIADLGLADRREPSCPLCLEAFCANSARNRPTAEHVIQSSLGGTLAIATLTCAACNSRSGGKLESHLINAMRVADFMDGNGTIPGVIHNDVGHLAVNLDWNNAAPVKINVLGEKASNMAAIAALPSLIRPDEQIKFTLKFGFAPAPYWRAILRTAYLVSFWHFGYPFALSAGAAQVREALNGPEVPHGAIMEAYPASDIGSSVAIHSIGTSGILVLFRVKARSTRWLAALMPGVEGCSWNDVESLTAQPQRLMLEVARVGTGERIPVRFDFDPIERFRRFAAEAHTSRRG